MPRMSIAIICSRRVLNMQIFRNISVAKKLSILVIVALSALLSVGFLGFMDLKETGSNLELIYTKKMQAVKLAGEAKYLLRHLQLRAVLSQTATSKEKRTTLLKEFQDGAKEFNQVIDDCLALEENQSGLQDVKAHAKTWEDTMQQVTNLAIQGKVDDSVALYNQKGVPDTTVIRKDVIAIQKLAIEDAKAIYEKSIETERNAVRNILIAIALAAVVLIGFSVFIVRLILSSLSAMTDVCK